MKEANLGQRVLVCGGRDYRNRALLNAVLDLMHTMCPIDCIIEGEMTGADLMGRAWAELHNIRVEKYPAAWDDLTVKPCVVKSRANGAKYNACAGFIRNHKMLKEGKPNFVVGFGGNTGTTDMINRAANANVLHQRFP